MAAKLSGSPSRSCDIKPISPEKDLYGPVIPRRTAWLEKIAFLTEFAAAEPFHIDSSPERVWRIEACGTIVMDRVCSSCLDVHPSIEPAPQAAAMPV